jgi:two-component sensor histidine kinase
MHPGAGYGEFRSNLTTLSDTHGAMNTSRRSPGDGPRWPGGAPDCTVTVAGGTSAPGEVRRALAEHVDGRLDPARNHELMLLVSELVTNAVRHGGARTTSDSVVASLSLGDRVYFEVCDGGPGFRVDGDPTPRGDGGGFGLMLVDTMSLAWGMRDRGGACVWFELAC